MTGLEIAAVVVIGVFAIGNFLALIGLGTLLLESYRRDRRQQRRRPPPDFSIEDLSLQATRDRVEVGQNTDVRFYFSVANPERRLLQYEASVSIEEIPPEPNQANPGFDQVHLRTAVPRLHSTWSTPGQKRVTAELLVWEVGRRAETAMPALAQGSVLVVEEGEGRG